MRPLDDLYWVMSYSRWKDERYWPAFRSALLREHSSLTEEELAKAREFNFQRDHFQGIGRYEPDAAYQRGLADLGVLADLIPERAFIHGAKPTKRRRRRLWLYRQYPFLRYRHAAQAIRFRAAESRASLRDAP